MANKRYSISAVGEMRLSTETADKLICSRDGTAAILLLWIMRRGGMLDTATASSELKMGEEDVLSCARRLEEMGAITPFVARSPADELPEYDVRELTARTKSDSRFAAVVDETQRVLGKMLSGSELRTLFGIYDFLGLPADVILLLVNYCVEQVQRRSGEGRLPGMRYIEKEAYVWANKEILTMDQAEEYLKKQGYLRSAEESIRRLLGITDRNMSPTERKYIGRWAAMGFGDGVVELAYDKTVVNTGSLKWAYMDKILSSWHGKGLHTLEEVEKGDLQKKGRPSAPGKDRTMPDSGDLERMKRMLDKMKNG